MANNLFILFIFFAFLVINCFSSLLWLASKLGPKKSSKAKGEPFECGIYSININTKQQRIDLRFFLIAVAFIIFDTATVLLFPWVAHYKALPKESFYYILFFSLLLSLAYLILWWKGVFDWNKTPPSLVKKEN